MSFHTCPSYPCPICAKSRGDEAVSELICKCGHEQGAHLRDRLSCYFAECPCIEFTVSHVDAQLPSGSVVLSAEQVEQIKAWRDGARFDTDRANDATAEFRSGWSAALDAVIALLDGERS